MSYKTIAAIAADRDIQSRVSACAATFNVQNPAAWAMEQAWRLATSEGWETAYEQAVTDDTGSPGSDESVITDGMILSAVQAIRASEPETEGLS